jgi:hypothetical protein
VARVHDPDDPTEVHAVGAVRVGASGAQVRRCLAEPGCLKWSDDLVELGVFGGAPSVADAEGLTLDPRHLRLLEKCQVGRCELRLPEDVILRVRALPWGTPGATAAAGQVVREFLARHAARYRERGHQALPVFADRRRPVSSGDSTRVLLARPLPLLDLADGLGDHVRDPMGAPGPEVSYLFWYKERFFRAVRLGVDHVAVSVQPGPAGDVVVAASKQVVGTSYLDASLEVTAFLPSAEGGGVVAFESRARTDIRPSGFTWLEKLLLRRLVRRRLEDQLTALRARLHSVAAVR